MSLKQQILAWDGKSADDIGAIYEQHRDTPGLFARIISLIAQSQVQKGATKLLKLHIESGQRLKPAEVEKLCKLLPALEHWESRLHILQCLSEICISSGQKKRFESFLRRCLTEETKFVRAWAYSGFYELASQHSEYREEVELFFKMALKDEVPSVQSRIRNVVKKGFSR